MGGAGKRGKDVNPNDISLLSIPKQTKFFVEALRLRTDQEGSKVLEFQDMVDIGKSMNLQTGDFKQFIDKLNAQGILLKKNAKQY